jgi:hypothetical protein
MHATRDEPSLVDFWRRCARGATDTQLALCAALLPMTVIASIIIAFARPQWTLVWWPVAALPLIVAALGIWGIGDRELAAPPPQVGTQPAKWGWRFVQALAAIVAGLSAVVVVLWFLARVVGTWIS